MRLPWPLSWLAGDGSPASEDHSAAESVPAPPREAPPTGAWAALPPIQRSVGDPPLVAPAATFLTGVPGARPLPPIVESLGHDVSPVAPAGIVAAPVRSVASLTRSATLVPPPVQRRTAATDGPEPVSAPPPSDDPAPSHGIPQPAPVEQPVRSLGIVPVGAEARPPAQSLTAAPPLLARLHSRGQPGGSPSAAVQREASAVGPSQHDALSGRSPALPSADSVPSLAIGGRPRRPGLGAPLPAAPGTTVAATGSAGTTRTPLVARSASGGWTADANGTVPTALASAPARGFRAAAAARPLRTSIQRASAASVDTTDDDPRGDTPSTAGPPDAQGASPSLPGRSLPVLRPAGSNRDGASPFDRDGGQASPGGPLQRTRSATGATTAPTGAPAPAAIAGPVSRRPLVGARPALAALSGGHALESRAETTGPDPDGTGFATSVSTAASAAPEIEGGFRAGSHALVSGLGSGRSPVQRSAAATALPLVQQPPSAASPLEAGAAPAPPAAQQLPQPAPVLAPAATPVVQRVDGVAAPPPPESEGQSESDLDDLARKLFGRIRNRLRAELIYEREAKGLSFDN